MTGRCPDVRSNKYIFAFNISDSAFAAYFWSVARVLMLTGIAHTFKTLVFPHLPPQQLPCPTPFPSAVAVCWLLNMYFNRRIITGHQCNTFYLQMFAISVWISIASPLTGPWLEQTRLTAESVMRTPSLLQLISL